MQDEHPVLPESISMELADFLLVCFQKDPQRRPDARALLGHPWLRAQRATLRASWSRTAGARARSRATDAHASVSSVVERILRVSAYLLNHSCWAINFTVLKCMRALSHGHVPSFLSYRDT